MIKKLSWRRVAPVIAAGMLFAGLLSFTGSSARTSANGWDRHDDSQRYFLKLSDVTGDSQDPKHQGEIELYSYSWGDEEPGVAGGAAGGGGGGAESEANAFRFTAKTSKASPVLMLKAANGTHLPEALLTVRKGGKSQHEYFKIKLTDVVVSSYQTTADDGDAPTDAVTLAFATAELQFDTKNTDGTPLTIKHGWDFGANTEL